jgi:hypothetical protein
VSSHFIIRNLFVLVGRKAGFLCYWIGWLLNWNLSCIQKHSCAWKLPQVAPTRHVHLSLLSGAKVYPCHVDSFYCWNRNFTHMYQGQIIKICSQLYKHQKELIYWCHAGNSFGSIVCQFIHNWAKRQKHIVEFPVVFKASVRSNFFSQRVVNTWNSLPESVITAPTVNSFKSRLDAFWKDSPSVRVYTPSCYWLMTLTKL